MDAGYVYVLINPSMSGIVKIGKTNRDPNQSVAGLLLVMGFCTVYFETTTIVVFWLTISGSGDYSCRVLQK
jgi:hypothetical protein